MDKINFKNSKGLNLVWNLYKSNSDSIVIMCPWYTNDKSSQWRFDSIANNINKSLYNVLSFDFSWCWESDDEIISIERHKDDLNSAIKYVKSLGYKNIWLFWYSWGSRLCLECFSSDISTIILLWAWSDSVKYDWLKYYGKDKLNDLETKWYLEDVDDTRIRKIVKIWKQTLKDFEGFSQKELLSTVDCPVLIIHWNNPNDKEELDLLSMSKKWIRYLSKDSVIEIINWADHSFNGYIDEVSKLSCDWFLKYLS